MSEWTRYVYEILEMLPLWPHDNMSGVSRASNCNAEIQLQNTQGKYYHKKGNLAIQNMSLKKRLDRIWMLMQYSSIFEKGW